MTGHYWLITKPELQQRARQLAESALASEADNIGAVPGRLFFLGIRRVSGSSVLKVTMRRDELRSTIYSIQYVLSHE